MIYAYHFLKRYDYIGWFWAKTTKCSEKGTLWFECRLFCSCNSGGSSPTMQLVTPTVTQIGALCTSQAHHWTSTRVFFRNTHLDGDFLLSPTGWSDWSGAFSQLAYCLLRSTNLSSTPYHLIPVPKAGMDHRSNNYLFLCIRRYIHAQLQQAWRGWGRCFIMFHRRWKSFRVKGGDSGRFFVNAPQKSKCSTAQSFLKESFLESNTWHKPPRKKIERQDIQPQWTRCNWLSW